MNIKDKNTLKNIIIKLLDIEQKNHETLKYDTNLETIGLDSLKFINLIVSIEREFGIEIRDSDLVLSKFESINEIEKTLTTYISNKSLPLKKVIISDCDNVLWNGISGEEDIVFTQANLMYQKMLLNLYSNGILICLCSRNELVNIKDAFKKKEMLLHWEHIASMKVNHNNKAKNISDISKELNLSTDSMVFVDDSKYEIGLINSILPEVDTVLFEQISVVCEKIKDWFSSTPNATLNRTELYKQQKEREKAKLHYTSIEEYNTSLNTQIFFNLADQNTARRVSELTQRTNQFNLSGKHYTEDDIISFIDGKKYTVLTMSANDKYGDMGIVGCVIFATSPDAIITDFYLSCRVFDRGFENALLDEVKRCTHSASLLGVYNPNSKNHRYSMFYFDNNITQISS